MLTFLSSLLEGCDLFRVLEEALGILVIGLVAWVCLRSWRAR